MVAEGNITAHLEHLFDRFQEGVYRILAQADLGFRNTAHHLKLRLSFADFDDIHSTGGFEWIHSGGTTFKEEWDLMPAIPIGIHQDVFHPFSLQKISETLLIGDNVL